MESGAHWTIEEKGKRKFSVSESEDSKNRESFPKQERGGGEDETENFDNHIGRVLSDFSRMPSPI